MGKPRILRVFDETGNAIAERNLSGSQTLSEPKEETISITASNGEVGREEVQVSVSIVEKESKKAEATKESRKPRRRRIKK